MKDQQSNAVAAVMAAAKSTQLFEGLRRIALIVGLTLAAFLATWTDSQAQPFNAYQHVAYPFRSIAYIPLLFTFLLYIFLPWPKRDSNVCAYKTWVLVLTDFAGTLLFAIFMALPLFIVGSALEAVTSMIIFTAVFWGLASFGLCCLWWSYFYAAYRIYILDDRLILSCPKGVKSILYADITTFELVKIVPPRWLIAASLISAVARPSTAGRGALLATNSSTGICIADKNDDAVYAWITNSMGQESMSNLPILLSKLKEYAVEELSHVREIERIFPPVIEKFSLRKTSRLIQVENQQEEPLVERASKLLQN